MCERRGVEVIVLVGMKIIDFADYITLEVYGESIEEVELTTARPLDRGCGGVDEIQVTAVGSPQN